MQEQRAVLVLGPPKKGIDHNGNHKGTTSQVVSMYGLVAVAAQRALATTFLPRAAAAAEPCARRGLLGSLSANASISYTPRLCHCESRNDDLRCRRLVGLGPFPGPIILFQEEVVDGPISFADVPAHSWFRAHVPLQGTCRRSRIPCWPLAQTPAC